MRGGLHRGGDCVRNPWRNLLVVGRRPYLGLSGVRLSGGGQSYGGVLCPGGVPQSPGDCDVYVFPCLRGGLGDICVRGFSVCPDGAQGPAVVGLSRWVCVVWFLVGFGETVLKVACG